MSMFMGHSYEWWSSQFMADYEKGVVYSLYGRFKDKRPIGSVHNKSGYIHLFKRGDDGVGMTVKVHRLIYFLYHEEITENLVIDHFDRNKQNNSISNLREVTRMVNSQNIDEVDHEGNYIGVNVTNFGTWEFRLFVNGKNYFKCGFSTAYDAFLARSYLKSVLT